MPLLHKSFFCLTDGYLLYQTPKLMVRSVNGDEQARQVAENNLKGQIACMGRGAVRRLVCDMRKAVYAYMCTTRMHVEEKKALAHVGMSLADPDVRGLQQKEFQNPINSKDATTKNKSNRNSISGKKREDVLYNVNHIVSDSHMNYSHLDNGDLNSFPHPARKATTNMHIGQGSANTAVSISVPQQPHVNNDLSLVEISNPNNGLAELRFVDAINHPTAASYAAPSGEAFQSRCPIAQTDNANEQGPSWTHQPQRLSGNGVTGNFMIMTGNDLTASNGFEPFDGNPPHVIGPMPRVIIDKPPPQRSNALCNMRAHPYYSHERHPSMSVQSSPERAVMQKVIPASILKRHSKAGQS